MGDRIRERRTIAGHTQQQLADALGLTRTSAVNIEKGRQHLAVHQLVRVADFLGCAAGELIPSLEPVDALSDELREKAPDKQSLRFLSAISDDAGGK
jgi:transcriptional regulator with XRE-family HTH domain